MEEHMKTKKIFILPTILILILCISTVPVRAATLGKVTGIKVKQLSEEKAKLTWIPKSWAKGYEVYQKSGSGKYKKSNLPEKQPLPLIILIPDKLTIFVSKHLRNLPVKKFTENILLLLKLS